MQGKLHQTAPSGQVLFNRDWTLRKLYEELRGEHSCMTGEKL
ncbi:MAG: hypothetical protein ACTTK0_04480 [Stomatobaculum sp.]